MKHTFLIGLVAVVMLLAQADVAKKGSFDIKEADGQAEDKVDSAMTKKGSFDLTIASGKDPEVPTTPGKKGSFDTPNGKDPEFPVTPNKKGSFDITELDGKGDE